MPAELLDSLRRRVGHGGREFYGGVLRLGFGSVQKREREGVGREPEEGEDCEASGRAAWRPRREEEAPEAPRWRPRRSARHRAASGAGEEEDKRRRLG